MTDWDDVLAAVAAAIGGDKPEARRLLTDCWNRTSADDHGQRCVLAHYLADVQDELDAETGWDETALHTCVAARPRWRANTSKPARCTAGTFPATATVP